MSAPAPPYEVFTPQTSQLRPMNHPGVVSFVLGLLITFGLVVYAIWVAIAALATVGGAAQHVATTPPAVTAPVAPTPSGITMAFDQMWTAGDGNTVVAGVPVLDTSTDTGESVIRVAVILINNGEQDWDPVSTTFVGKLNRTPVPESTDGDWMYSTPIVAHTSVTLTKEFVADTGQFTLTVATPHGVALFAGRV